jgi:hypothetical protein
MDTLGEVIVVVCAIIIRDIANALVKLFSPSTTNKNENTAISGTLPPSNASSVTSTQ